MNVGVLGCGYWGKNLVRNLHALGALGAIVDPSPEARDVAAKVAPGVPLHADARRVLGDPSISAIVVATPAATHAEVCCAALEAGKDVLCEKPLALSYDDADKAKRLAERLGRILMVGHILEYHPAVVSLRALVADGRLGTLQYIYSHRLNLGKVRREENILWSLAPHDIALILRLTGALPIQVIAAGGAHIQPGVYDTTVTHLVFEQGLAAHVFVSWLNPFKEQRLVVVGTKAMAVFDDVRRKLVVHDQPIDVKNGAPVPAEGEGTKIDYGADEPLRLECEAFLDAIRTRTPPFTDAASALRVLRVIEAAQRSLATHGQPVALPAG
jgi:predicted dehydrogenase